MQDFSKKLAVITGGASGIGRSLAFALGAEGARVLIGDVDDDALSAVLDDLKAANVDAYAQRCDVTQPDHLEQLVDRAYNELGGAHMVFANAGIGAGEAGPIWGYADNDWKWSFDVNFWGVVNTVNAFMPKLAAQARASDEAAHIMITGSGNGAFLIYPDTPIYSATKAAVQAVTEALYHQLAAANSKVRVHALFPGPHVVDTGIFNSDRVRPAALAKSESDPDSGITTVEDLRRMMAEHNLTLQTTHPDEVAQTALQGIRDDRFWVINWNDKTQKQFEERTQSIITKTNPSAAIIG